MDAAWVLRGKYANGMFVPDQPLPDVEGPAELIVYAQQGAPSAASGDSMFNLFGKVQPLRSGKELDEQLESERASWPEP